MVLATLVIHETNGATGSESDTLVTNTNWVSTDAANQTAADHPITATAGGASFEKWHRVLVTLNDSTSVDNFKTFFSTYSAVAGATLVTNASDAAYTSANYSTPEANTNKVSYNFPTANPGSANVNIADSLTASITNSGSYSDYVIHVLAADATATEGPSANWEISWLYDETT